MRWARQERRRFSATAVCLTASRPSRTVSTRSGATSNCFRLQGSSTINTFIDNLADQIYDYDADISGYLGAHDNGSTTVQLGGTGPSLEDDASGILATSMVVKRKSTGGPINY